jgi:Cu(I)/Ag(I) efflux system protein CusF
MKVIRVLLAAASVVAVTAHAQAGGTNATNSQPVAASSIAPATDGVVRKVDKEQGKLTLKHGRIENLDMPGMTMVFNVADPKLLEGLKEGDKVKFVANNVNGALTVTAIQAVK